MHTKMLRVTGSFASDAAGDHVRRDFSLHAQEIVSVALERRHGLVDIKSQDDVVPDVTEFDVVGARHAAYHLVVAE